MEEIRIVTPFIKLDQLIKFAGLAETGAKAKILIELPETQTVPEMSGGKKIRIVFNGESSFKPVIANMIFECRTPVNILHADTKDLDGKAFGQMLIQLPEDEKSAGRATEYLRTNGIEYTEI